MKVIRNTSIWAVLCVSLSVSEPLAGETAVVRPYIWATTKEKPAILARIKEDANARDLVGQLHARIDAAVKTHLTDPSAVLKTMPALGGNVQAHRSYLNTTVFAAVLYYLTEDPKYGQFTADVLNAYFQKLASKEPKATKVIGNHFEDGRWTFPNLAIAYDLIHPFLVNQGVRVYDPTRGKRVPFDDTRAQKVMRNIASHAVGEFGGPDRRHGKIVSNHHILTAKGALYPILCIDDAKVRDRLFNIYWDKGSRPQASMRRTIIPMFTRHGQGILPESTSYGMMTPLGVLETIDRVKPGLKALECGKEILEGRFMFPQLTHPDGLFVRYGDSKRRNGSPAAQMRMVRRLAIKLGYKEMQRKSEAFLKLYPVDGKQRLKEYSSCGYLFRTPPPPFDPKTIDGTGEIKRTVIVKHAGIALVRNYVKKKNELYGLNGCIGGAHYVHSHCTGIGMELYGAGYVMAPNAGMPPAVKDRKSPPHANYARLYAGNNTVIVNGTSHGSQRGAWKTKSNVWQNTAVNVACEPGHLKEPVSPHFGFATQSLKDTVNDCVQQRTLAVIRTSPTSGYYLDVFRSRSNKKNRFHDYVYHNLGDSMTLSDAKNQPYKLSPTDRYDNDIGDVVKSPGWRFFEDERSTKPTVGGARATFKVDHDSRFMHLHLPVGVRRQYTKAVGPPTREAKNGYVKKKTQILVVRQDGEAWKVPFAVVLEPSLKATPTVVAVRHVNQGDALVAIEVTSLVGGKTITDVIISQDKADASVTLADRDVEFKGRFAIVRTEVDKRGTRVSLYIGDGSSLRSGKHQISGNEEKSGFKNF